MKQPGGNLYLIPTPLGDSPVDKILPFFNIGIILSLDEFIVEEVRTARRFLRKIGYELDFEMVTFHILNEHTTEMELSGYLASIFKGKNIGLLSEAGVPCVADPGAKIVELAHLHQIRVIPLVGPSSIILALMASGFNGQNFAFIGYLPAKKEDRNKKIREVERNIRLNHQTQVFIEAPYRNMQMLESIISSCSPDLRLCIACDITLDSEMIVTRTLREWKTQLPDINKRATVFLLYL
ncbi:MAG TPA: SAM-dependent methyltransferase [Bacteroidales bacterium]|nr:SAM-dependent methyltransferase [Bacteroidales bacterium]